jgi:crotonobetainyl-CoA:carnitine CoA-transferase CaiB-like acyl-CoA transferase
MRAYDMLVQAESGICAVTGTPDTPSKIGVSAADIATGMNAHAAILEALLAREKTGRGRVIEIAMFDCMADWMTVPLLHYEYTGRETARYGLAHSSIYPYRPCACRDGVSVAVSVQQNSEWKRFCSIVLRRQELADDERFATNALRVANREALDAEVEPIFASIDSDEAIHLLDQAQNAWGRVNAVRDLAKHKAMRRIEVALPDGKTVAMPKPSVRSEAFETLPRVPALGADTDRIRAEFGT